MIKYNGRFCLLLAFLMLVLPLPWLLLGILAATVHELFHYFAIVATGNRVYSLELTHNGAVMHTSSMSLGQELVCATAGPLGSLLLFCCYPWIPGIALCAGIQGAFNLLPIGNLDGGRIMSCLLRMVFPRTVAQNIGTIVEIGLLLAAAVLLCRTAKWGYGPIFLFLLLLSRYLTEKFLAKKAGCEYNSATKVYEVVL